MLQILAVGILHKVKINALHPGTGYVGADSNNRDHLPLNGHADTLSGIHGVFRVRYAPGQVIFYENHYPPGLFVLLRGGIAFDTPAGGDVAPISRDAGDGMTIFPARAEIDAPAGRTARALTEVELLLIPRSIIYENARLSRLLDGLHIAECPLRVVV